MVITDQLEPRREEQVSRLAGPGGRPLTSSPCGGGFCVFQEEEIVELALKDIGLI